MSNDKRRKQYPTATIVLDKLVFSCQSTVEDNFNYVVIRDPEYFHNDFQFGKTKLVRTNDPSNRYRHSFKVYYSKYLMGLIDFSLYNNGIYTEMLRFSVYNEVFYNDTLKHIPMILNDLNLEINNFKEIDIAVDSYTLNVEQTIRRCMLDKNNTVKLLGKIITDRNKLLKERTFYNSGSLNNPYKLRSVLIKGKDRRKELAFYDKGDEIKEVSKKNYISEFHQQQNPKCKKIHRAEMRFKYDEIRKYIKKIKRPISLEDLLNPQFLYDMFFEYLDRIIAIYTGKGRKKTKIQLVEKPNIQSSQGVLQSTLSLTDISDQNIDSPLVDIEKSYNDTYSYINMFKQEKFNRDIFIDKIDDKINKYVT